jgi:hypothetical protein
VQENAPGLKAGLGGLVHRAAHLARVVLVAEIGQRACNPVITPAWIFLRPADNWLLDFVGYLKSANLSARIRTIELLGDQLLYQPRIVSGFPAFATSSSVCRPSQ